MRSATISIEQVRQLAAAGRDAAVVEYLDGQDAGEIEGSADLALLYGTAQARLGRHGEGARWLDLALGRARGRSERSVERRALNARGAVALVSGRVDESADYFTQALLAASRDGDVELTGRCSNNLGIISHLRGRNAEAVGSWEIALAAFERAGWDKGVAECRNNLGIAFREQGALQRALDEAGQAVTASRAAGDAALYAMALRCRAETRLAIGDVEQARRDLDAVGQERSRMPNAVERAEDLRVEAALAAARGLETEAERILREAIAAAGTLGRPQLLAEATRDLARLLDRAGRLEEAQAAARTAQDHFADLGAEAEVRRLMALARAPAGGEVADRMQRSLTPLHDAQALADAGRFTELVAYLGSRHPADLEESPLLALLNGIAHARLGRLELGRHWAAAALARAQVVRDRVLEARALNVCGAIALESGGLTEATLFFGQALEHAMKDEDLAAVGRCANNLGVIANIQGDFARAIDDYSRALAAYQRVDFARGVAESHHNLGISLREQGQLAQALEAADAAVREAVDLGDKQLHAQALAGRAEVRTALDEPDLAIHEARQALAMHRELKDDVRETEDLRILAVALERAGQVEDAEDMLRDVIERAGDHRRPLLLAVAQRDLAGLLLRSGETATARTLVRRARMAFARLGAVAELGKLDALLEARG